MYNMYCKYFLHLPLPWLEHPHLEMWNILLLNNFHEKGAWRMHILIAFIGWPWLHCEQPPFLSQFLINNALNIS